MLCGKNVGLRAVEKGDLSQLLEWRNQPEFRQYFREFRELNQSNQEEWFQTRVLQDAHTIMFSIVKVKTGELLGASGLCYIDWVNRSADFSLYIGKDGLYIDDIYAVEAAELMIIYGRDELNLHRFWTELYDIDTKKHRMFEKLGFKLEGRHKETHWTGGEWHDSLFYGLVVKAK